LTIVKPVIINRKSKIVNLTMARGWESKSIEQQIEDARTETSPSAATSSSSEDFKVRQKREGLLLQRSRILQEMAEARNPRYQEMLKEMLPHIDGLLASQDS
jgi:molecular chaperone GrpE (heat shock protein)